MSGDDLQKYPPDAELNAQLPDGNTQSSNVSYDTHLSTADRGKPDESVDSESGAARDLARAALADAQRIARGRRSSEAVNRDSSRRARTRRANLRRGGYSGAGPDERDPQPLGAILDRLLNERGWEQQIAEARVLADWAALVGPDIAGHCTPIALRAGELRVEADSTAWATQLRLLTSTMLARLSAQLGPGVVSRVQISGPVGPSWKHGPWSVPGRGPRDTYG